MVGVINFDVNSFIPLIKKTAVPHLWLVFSTLWALEPNTDRNRNYHTFYSLDYAHACMDCLLSIMMISSQKRYTLLLESNLSPHFYKFSRVETTVPGNRDSHVTLEFSAEVGEQLLNGCAKGSV